MKTITVSLVILGFVAGCASQQSSSPNPALFGRSYLRYIPLRDTSPNDCKCAGGTCNDNGWARIELRRVSRSSRSRFSER